MGEPIGNLNNAVKLADLLTVEQKELIKKELWNKIKPRVGTWASRVSSLKVPAPYKTITFRTAVYNKPEDIGKAVLLEGIKPDPTKGVKYTERRLTTQPLGWYKDYTDEALEYTFDEVVRDNTEDLANMAKGSIDNDIAKLYVSGNNVVSAADGLTRELISKIRIYLGKFTDTSDKQVYCILTPEDSTALRLKYNVPGANLFQDLPQNEGAVINATLTRFEKVIFEEDDNINMYSADGTKRYALFYIKDNKGRYPVSGSNNSNLEFIQKPLGSSGTDDPLNQKGSFGIKMQGYGNAITADECLVRVEITASGTDIDTVKGGYDYDSTGYIGIDGTTKENKNSDGTAALKVDSPKSLVISATATTLSIAGTKTATISAKDALTGSSVTGFTLTSEATSIATVSGTTVTGVKAGKVKILVVKEGYLVGAITMTVTA